jgi:quinol monooxygenase YgiN
MSVLITLKVGGDVAKFRAALDERADEFEAHSERSRNAGAVHHRFGIGDGFVVVVDEWESAEQFEKFFSDPVLQEFIASIGGDTSKPPEMSVSEAVDAPGTF